MACAHCVDAEPLRAAHPMSARSATAVHISLHRSVTAVRLRSVTAAAGMLPSSLRALGPRVRQGLRQLLVGMHPASRPLLLSACRERRIAPNGTWIGYVGEWRRAARLLPVCLQIQDKLLKALICRAAVAVGLARRESRC